MKLTNKWPSAHKWLLQLSANAAYVGIYKEDPEGERKALLEACGATQVSVTPYSDGEYNLNVDIWWSTLKNDQKPLKALGFLKERYGVFGFQAELVVNAFNEYWCAYIAYYTYNPAKYHGVRRCYLSCAECEFLLRFTDLKEIYTVFDHTLLLRNQENLQEVGGIFYVDFENHPVQNKRSVLLPDLEEET